MVNMDKVEKQLQLLRKYLRILKELGKCTLDEFLADPRNYGSAERFLQLSIETTLNIGNHVISAFSLDPPQDYSDIFAILGKNNIIPADFAGKMANMARFRNRLVHIYWDIDTVLVYRYIRENIDDFEVFARHILVFIENGAHKRK